MEPGPPAKTRTLLLLLVGVILGATVTGAAWTFTSLVGGGQVGGPVGAASDVAVACEVIGRVEPIDTYRDLSLEMALRVGAAQALVSAAAKSDTRFAALDTLLTRTRQAIQAADVEQVNVGLDDARDECGRI